MSEKYVEAPQIPIPTLPSNVLVNMFNICCRVIVLQIKRGQMHSYS